MAAAAAGTGSISSPASNEGPRRRHLVPDPAIEEPDEPRARGAVTYSGFSNAEESARHCGPSLPTHRSNNVPGSVDQRVRSAPSIRSGGDQRINLGP